MSQTVTLHALGFLPEQDPLAAATRPGDRGEQETEESPRRIPGPRYKAACRAGLPEAFRTSAWLKSIADLEDDADVLAFAGTPEHLVDLRRRWEARVRQLDARGSLELQAPEALGCPRAVLEPLSAEKQTAVARVLTVFEQMHVVGFSPILLRLVPRLLLYGDEAVAYHIIDAMWRRRPFFFPKTPSDWAAFLTTFGSLVENFFPETHAFMNERGAFEDPSADHIVLRLFEDLLPLPALLRFLDAYCLEGQKVIFRVLLGVLKLCKRALKDSTVANAPDTWALLEDFAKHRCDADSLMLAAYGNFHPFRRNFRRSLLVAIMAAKIRRPEHPERTQRIVSQLSPRSAARHSEALGSPRRQRAVLRPLRLRSSELVVEQPLSEAFRGFLASWLPEAFRGLAISVLFDSSRDGSSLGALYRLNNPATHVGAGPAGGTHLHRLSPARILVVSELGSSNVAGVFTTEPWRVHHEGYGSGQNFVFRLHPDPMAFQWNSREHGDNYRAHASRHMIATNEYLAAGGSRVGADVALQLDQDLLEGQSRRSDTYTNEPLFSRETFQAQRVVIYGMGRG